MTNIFIPAITILVYIAIAIAILFPLIRFLIRFWRQKFKFILRYKIFRQAYDTLIVEDCYKAMERKWDNIRFKMELLKIGYSNDEIYEILYVYNKVKSEMGVRDVINNKVKGGKIQ